MKNKLIIVLLLVLVLSLGLTACDQECKHKNIGTLIPATDATCIAEGTVAHYKCADCGVYLDTNLAVIETISTPTVDHDYGELIPVVASTCSQAGTVAHYTCGVCGKHFDEQKVELASLDLALANHKFVNAVCSVCEYDAHFELVDYVNKVQFDPSSGRASAEVELKSHIDGDTSHFYVSGLPADIAPGGVLKARYLAVDTPESTGRIENYGKTASRFTKEKLTNAYKIMVESDTATWNVDSTGDRALVWVWYKETATSTWRNLNVEILQNGLAVASNTRNNSYGEDAFSALSQAQRYKITVHSGVADPEVPGKGITAVTLRELRTNIDIYNNSRVSFEGVVTLNSDQSVYVEEYDEETGMYYGMVVYYGFNLPGAGLEILQVGNRVKVVGVVQYWETGGTYQVTDLRHSITRPTDPNNCQLISKGHEGAFQKVTGAQFNGTVQVPVLDHETGEESLKTLNFGEASLNTTISMDNLYVQSAYTTNNGGDNDGAMTLTCTTADGKTVTVRTVVLYQDGKLVTEADLLGKTINVKGIVELFNGKYQIKVVATSHITYVD